MGNDIRKMDNFTLDLLTNSEILAVNQDIDCIQGSLARAEGATETWIKPLNDGSFAATLLNKGSDETNCTIFFTGDWDSADDFYPCKFDSMHVRDLYTHKDLGVF